MDQNLITVSVRPEMAHCYRLALPARLRPRSVSAGGRIGWQSAPEGCGRTAAAGHWSWPAAFRQQSRPSGLALCELLQTGSLSGSCRLSHSNGALLLVLSTDLRTWTLSAMENWTPKLSGIVVCPPCRECSGYNTSQEPYLDRPLLPLSPSRRRGCWSKSKLISRR